MNDKRNSGHSGGMALNDIYFVLFRNKWKIIILSALGFLTAAGIYAFKPPVYQSEANLYIKYVRRDTPQARGLGEAQNRELDPGVEGVIGAEVAILNSFDLALQVATNIGPARILGNPGGANDSSAANAAANKIRDNLVVDRINRTSVLRIVFSHPDLTLVQPVLQQLIEDYEMRHKDIHNASMSYDDLVKEADNRHKEVQQTEEELSKAKKEANVYNVDKKREEDEQNLSVAHQQIILVTAEIAEHQSKLDRLKPKTMVTATNSVATNVVSTNVQADIPKEKITRYQDAIDLLTDLKKDYTKMRSNFPEHNKLVQEKKVQIDEQEKVKKKMEEDEPRLVDYADPATKGSTAIAAISGLPGDTLLKQEEAAVESLQRKLKIWQDSYEETRADSANLDARQFYIHELEHKLKRQQEQYDYFDNALQAAKSDADMGTAKDANISVVEKPMPPAREKAKTPKMMGVAAGAGIVLGLAWAFLRELYFDHSVKRAKDIEGDLGMRLFLSIPDMRRNGHRRKPKALLPEGDGKNGAPDAGAVVPVANGMNGNSHMEVAPWDHNHSLHHHYEALRDRLITYFEVNNLNHKPKLVAVTGSSHGSGTSTIAAGLAASLSETGDGNVLLIDMNLEQGAAQQFYKGKPHCELDAALEGNTMEKAMIQDNLYVVAGRTNNGDKLSSMLPKRFANLIPKLKASDYDYIIFDMPPISRTGVTQRLAGFMDMMMLVVEAEKTNRDVVRQASALLTESKAKVSVVLNKTRSYVPARLHQEF